MNNILIGKRVLVIGGTGSLGKVLVHELLSGRRGQVGSVMVMSRDEAKQYQMMVDLANHKPTTEELIYKNWTKKLKFLIGDVRDYSSVVRAIDQADVVIDTAALKQVPSCEFFPIEAVKTNILGIDNVVRAIVENRFPVKIVVGISTDKACKPVNVMGMTKAIQERILVQANLLTKTTKFVGVRYGNVLASRGSVVPLFHKQITTGGPVTITTPNMTRFLLSLEQAADTVFTAIGDAHAGEIYVPRIKSAKIMDVAKALIGKRKIKITEIGIRPGEKVHESLVSEEEMYRTRVTKNYLVIKPMLGQRVTSYKIGDMKKMKEFNSKNEVMSFFEVKQMLKRNKMLIEDRPIFS